MSHSSQKVPPPDLVPVRRALLSVSDKSGLSDFAFSLHKLGVEILSTGGTAKVLGDLGIPVVDISEWTGFPEILDGRVKTLHPSVHAGLLSLRDVSAHLDEMEQHGFSFIDLVVVDFYPFEEARRSGKGYGSIIDAIDIGGPTMVRAAAKNHAYVGVLTDSSDYPLFLEEMKKNNGFLTYAFRRQLAAKAFSYTAAYDGVISNWFSESLGIQHPRWCSFVGKLDSDLRYGENPHQSGSLYVTADDRPGAATASQLQGKSLSWNNLNDTDAAFELVAEFLPDHCAAVVIVKHANPCGVAQANTVIEAWKKALSCDPVSAFGGVVAFNRAVDAETAEELIKMFIEVVIAPDVTQEARVILEKKKNIRVLITGELPDPSAPGFVVKSIASGLLVQSRDSFVIDNMDLKVVTDKLPSDAEVEDLIFAYRVSKHVKSNAIVYAHQGRVIGIGAGQTSRLDSARIGIRKFEGALETQSSFVRCVLASDGFFPFSDALLTAIEAGVSAVIQPGGSIRDDEVIAAANAHGISMIFTGVRHFKH